MNQRSHSSRSSHRIKNHQAILPPKTNSSNTHTSNTDNSNTHTSNTHHIMTFHRRSSSRSNKFVASLKEPEEKDFMLLREQLQQQQEEKWNTKFIRNRKKEETMKPRAVVTKVPKKSTDSSPSKIKVARHSLTRKHISTVDDDEDDDDNDSHDHESDQEEQQDADKDNDNDTEEPLKIQRIIAVRMQTLRQWHNLCQQINTTEIDNGSRWFQPPQSEESSSQQDDDHWDKYEERFLVKWADLSFLHCSWEKEADLMDQVENAKAYITTFFKKSTAGCFYDAEDRLDGEYFDPSFCQIERILEVSTLGCPKGAGNTTTDTTPTSYPWGIILDKNHPDYEDATGRQFLIKWGNTPYSDATYEYERDLILMEVEYESHLQDFQRRTQKPTEVQIKKQLSYREEGHRRMYKIFGDKIKDDPLKKQLIEEYRQSLEKMVYPSGGTLRDYQAEGVSWLLANHINARNSLLADGESTFLFDFQSLDKCLGCIIVNIIILTRCSSSCLLTLPFL